MSRRPVEYRPPPPPIATAKASMSKPRTPTVKSRIMQALTVIQPVTRTAERIATIALQARSLKSPLGVIGLASTAANALRDQFHENAAPTPCDGFRIPVPHGYLVGAYRQAGCQVAVEVNESSKGTKTEIIDGEASIRVYTDGSISILGSATFADLTKRVTQVLDAHLPMGLLVKAGIGGGYPWDLEPAELTRYESTQGKAISEATTPLLTGGRVILLNGAPGVGKSTIAQEVARLIGGRVLILGAGVFCPKDEDSHPQPGPLGQLAMLSPSVVIIDDVDKLRLYLTNLEALRSIAKLVILTANNGEYDDVLDGAIDRPGRTDETFDIKQDGALPPSPPFDKLDAETWNKVKGWPIAYLNELRKRIEERGVSPVGLNLIDLERRLLKGVRSGNTMHSRRDD